MMIKKLFKPADGGSRKLRMLNEPISRLIPSLAVPTIISMLITSIYNMADTYVVSQLGTSASGAVGVVFSAMAMIQAMAFTIGMGCGANASQLLGAGNQREAERFICTGFFTALITGVVVAVCGLVAMEPLMSLLGATPTILPYAKEYASWIFIGSPFMMSALVLNTSLRFQGMAVYGMVGITTGGILNMLLDPLFIFGLGMGTAGAGCATAVSQTVSMIILITMCNTREGVIHLRLRDFSPSFSRYGKILYTGGASMARQGIGAVSTAVLNNVAGLWGDPAIAAMSIVTRFTMFVNSTVIGFGQGFQPVCAFCYGAWKYRRVREAYWFCVKVATGVLLTLGVIAFLFASPIMGFFRPDDAEVIAIGTVAMRAQMVTVPLWGVIVMSNMFTQSIGYGIRAAIVASSRQGLFLIPALLIMPPLMGLLGLQLSQAVSDVLSFGLSLVISVGILRKLALMPDREEPVQ